MERDAQHSIDFPISEIKRIIPQWTAGKLQASTTASAGSYLG